MGGAFKKCDPWVTIFISAPNLCLQSFLAGVAVVQRGVHREKVCDIVKGHRIWGQAGWGWDSALPCILAVPSWKVIKPFMSPLSHPAKRDNKTYLLKVWGLEILY